MAAFHVFRLHENAGRRSNSEAFRPSGATTQQSMQGKLVPTPSLFAPIPPLVPIHLQSTPTAVSPSTWATTQQSMRGKLVPTPSLFAPIASVVQNPLQSAPLERVSPTRARTQRSMQGKLVLRPCVYVPIAPAVQNPLQSAPFERVSLTQATTQQTTQGKSDKSSPLMAPIAPMVPIVPRSAPSDRASTVAGNLPRSPAKRLRLSPSKPKRRGRKPRSKDIARPTAKSLFAPLVPTRRSSRLLSNKASSCDVPTPATSITKPERLQTRASKTMNSSAGIKKKRGRPPKSAVAATSTAPPNSEVPAKSTAPADAKTQEGEVVVETSRHRDKQAQRPIGKKSAFQRKWISQNEAVAGKFAKLQREREAKMREEVR